MIEGFPDVDKVYQETRPLPIHFPRDGDGDKTGHHEAGRAVVLPPNAFVPYSSRATLHTRSAFWAMFLPGPSPVTVQ